MTPGFRIYKLIFILSLMPVALKAQPALQWAKCYGGVADDHAEGVEKAWGGGYIIAGRTMSLDGDVIGLNGMFWDGWVVKTTSAGGIAWAKCYGGGGVDDLYSIQRVKTASDSGYIMAGNTSSSLGGTNHGMGDVWVIMIDDQGNVKWQKAFGGSSLDKAWSVHQTRDGGYIVAAETESTDGDVTGVHGIRDYWILKLNSQGGIVWQKTFGGTQYEGFSTLDATYDNGAIIAGGSASWDGDVSNNYGMADYWVVKLDSTGALQWEKSYGGSGLDYVFSIAQTMDSGYIMCGRSTFDPDSNGLFHSIIKTDKNGAVQWSAGPRETSDIIQTGDGKYVSVGWDSNGYVITKMSSNGGVIWNKSVGGDMWVVKLAPAPDGIFDVQTKNENVAFYPNPAKEEIRFSEKVNVKLLSYTGALLANCQGVHELDVSEQPAGLYFLLFYDAIGQLIQQEKLFKQ